MKISTASLATVLAASAAVNAAPATVGNAVEKRVDSQELVETLKELHAFNNKREKLNGHLDKREYEIVTKVLSALNNTQLAPKIIHYLATNPNLEPIVVKTLVTVIKVGAMNLTALFQALDESNLVGKVINDLISDCQLYVKLFQTAKKIIANLEKKVEELIENGVTSLIQKREPEAAPVQPIQDLDERDLDDIVVNLLESLGNSGLASSVVKSILTDSSYIPFAIDLVKQLIESKAVTFSQLLDAIKGSNLVSDLLKQFLTKDTFKTITTNAFAAFFGQCPASTEVVSVTNVPAPTSVAGTGANPCRKKRKRSYY